FEKPRNVFETAQELAKTDDGPPVQTKAQAATEGILGKPEPGHHRLLYRFSIGPWRVPGLFWPNLFGRWLPVNHRWLGGLLVENYVWTPSLYMGILPMLLALRVFSLRDTEPRWACMSWMVLLGIVGAFGDWGIGSLFELAKFAVTREYVTDQWIGRPVGGL